MYYLSLSLFRYACGYMKQPEQAFLNFKKFHANDDVEDGIMLLF